MNYPPTPRGDVVDDYSGQQVADPYRWLESDIRKDEALSAWVAAQNDLSRAYLAALPGHQVFRERLAALFDHARLTVPEKRGQRYFFTRNSGLDNQAVLFVREGVSGKDRPVIDPNAWSPDGSSALAEWAPSEDGRYVAYAIQDSGSDWRTIRILDVDTGRILEDVIHWARFTSLAWTHDGTGFFYGRSPEPQAGAEFVAPAVQHAIYFHRVGTGQLADRRVDVADAHLPVVHTVEVTADGRYAVIYTTAMAGGNGLAVVDLSEAGWPVRTVIAAFSDSWQLVGNMGTRLYVATQQGAERGRVMTVELAGSEPVFSELIAQREPVLKFGSLIGDRLFVSYMQDAKTQIARFTLEGRPDGFIDLPGLGSASPVYGRPGDDEAFFVYTSHDAPSTIYRYDVASNTKSVWAAPHVAIDLDRIRVEQMFYESKDGTRVPIFVVRRADVTSCAPTMLTAYGGFGISMVPYFSPAAMAWVEQGGVYAVANIRGGGEYGKTWHEAGRGHNKQNSFDDFIAAAEFLKREGICPPSGLAIHGESNGGLLVAAVVNQRPDLYAAAIPGVGVLDLLRFDRYTAGQFWTHEFGRPDTDEDFKNLRKYSPLHNVRPGVPYPAMLVTTADTDDRVVPAHSFKYVATLQHADLGSRPRLLRVDTQAGHGLGKPTHKAIAEIADMWTFAAYWTGLDVGREPRSS